MTQQKGVQQQSDHVITRIRSSKNKLVVVFRRRSLSISYFVNIGDGYVYQEDFSYKGIHGTIRIKVNDENLVKSIFRLKKKVVNVRGYDDNFCLTLQFPDVPKPCIDTEFTVGSVTIAFQCNGKVWPISSCQLSGLKSSFHNGKAFNKQPKITPTNGWAAIHPSSGGLVTPK